MQKKQEKKPKKKAPDEIQIIWVNIV